VHGAKSRQALVTLLGDGHPNLDCLKTDKYRRKVCRLRKADGFDVALEMVASGNARWYQKYAADQTAEERAAFSQAEDKAKRQNLGLWSAANVAPWDWRAARRGK
jgi:endonuclease YncB( thermonuclease family)